jgi:hypothetical protein
MGSERRRLAMEFRPSMHRVYTSGGNFALEQKCEGKSEQTPLCTPHVVQETIGNFALGTKQEIG